MADDADRAGEILDEAIARGVERVKPPPSGPGASECAECGDEIPAARQALGYGTCVECQTRAERPH